MPPSPTSLPAVSNKGGGASPPPASKKEASSSTQRALDREKAKADKKVAQLANERRIMMVRGRGERGGGARWEKAKADKKVSQLANERRIIMVRRRGRAEGAVVTTHPHT